jgi:hypothetical protein
VAYDRLIGEGFITARVGAGTFVSDSLCWWTRPGTSPANDFWAQGNHGQFIYVVPPATWSWSGSGSTTASPIDPVRGAAESLPP